MTFSGSGHAPSKMNAVAGSGGDDDGRNRRSWTVAATRGRPFDPILYGEDLAQELEAFVDESRRARKPFSLEKAKSQLEVDAFVEESRRARKPFSPEPSQSRLVPRRNDLGRAGDFRSVRSAMPLEMFLETNVCGPAAGWALALEERRDKSSLKRVLDGEDDRGPPSSGAPGVGADWRRNPNDFTRHDTDFLDAIEDAKFSTNGSTAGPALSRKPLPSNVGPRATSIDYTEVEAAASRRESDRGSTVRDQLAGRLIRAAAAAPDVVDGEPLNAAAVSAGSRASRKRVDTDRAKSLRLQNALRKFSNPGEPDASEAAGRSGRWRRPPSAGRDVGSAPTPLPSASFDRLPRRGSVAAFLSRDLRRGTNRMKSKLNDRRSSSAGAGSAASLKQRIEESECLFEAASEGCVRMAKLAIEHGAKVDFKKNGDTAFQMVFARVCRLEAGRPTGPEHGDGVPPDVDYNDILNLLYLKGCDVNDLDNSEGETPLHCAARLGVVSRVNWLLERGAKPDVRNVNGSTPLMLTCKDGHLDVAMKLLKNGANLESVDRSGMAALHYAAMSGNVRLLEFLIECDPSADRELRARDGSTAADICRRRGFASCAELLQKASVPRLSRKPFIDDLIEETPSPILRPRRPRKGSKGSKQKEKRETRRRTPRLLSDVGNWRLNWARMGGVSTPTDTSSNSADTQRRSVSKR